MSQGLLIIAGLFLPLFPLSMVFNEIFDRVRAGKLRILLLFIWPQVGIGIAHSAGVDIPTWIIIWALLTALLYGFRALVLRELSLWVSFLATSSWAVLWAVMGGDVSGGELVFYALGFSAPLSLLILLGAELEKRFGAAYAGLYSGIAQTLPRLSGVLVVVVLAVVATPIFPGFSTMLSATISILSQSFFAAFMVSVVWLVWAWAGVRLLQGFIVGESKDQTISDISSSCVWSYVLVLSVLGIGGIYMIGGLS